MRGRKAKFLRRRARAMTVGNPEKIYLRRAGQVVLSSDCTRGVYKNLKRLFKRVI
jgi:hypothetical protein